ncbi:MAG TPA: glycoside hydrolase N-terminal domain-containing protein, partial [Candidatus Limnocylindrales bacterium]
MTNVLWYSKPATSWDSHALPIGNGALGAMIFGGVPVERLQINEKSLWTGGPGSHPDHTFGNWPSPRPGALDEARRRIDLDGRLDNDEAVRLLGQPRAGYGAYQSLADLLLDFDHGGGDDVTGYRRELDIANAIARVTYRTGGVTHEREYFAGHPGNVIVARLRANASGRVTFTLRLDAAQPGAAISVSESRLTLHGALHDNALRYHAEIQVRAEGGQRVDGRRTITVTAADSAVIIVSAGTDYAAVYPHYRGEDPSGRVRHAVDVAAATPFEQLLENHRSDHRALFDRVTLDLGGAAPSALPPTDEQLAAYGTGDEPADRALEATY